MRMCALPPALPAFAAGLDGRFAADGALARHARWQPHDLLRLRRLPAFDGEPMWVREAFARAPFVVVRRAQTAESYIAVGVRGASRAQRYGTWVQASDIELTVSPDSLVALEPQVERVPLPAFAALAALRRAPGSLAQFVWGPTGSVGYELATRVPAATSASDLDLLILTPEKMPDATAIRLLSELNRHAQNAGVRVDVQLETPAGGVALAELAAGKPHVMVRAAYGPALVTDPWAVTTTRHA